MANRPVSPPAFSDIPSPSFLKKKETITIVTKFFAAMAVFVLALSVLVALVSVTSERNNLQDQLRTIAQTQACRAEAGIVVNRASANKQVALARQSALVGDFIVELTRGSQPGANEGESLARMSVIADKLEAAGVVLEDAGTKLEAAVTAQEKALDSC